VIKPRLAPALFGLGLLEAVPETAITDVVPTMYAGAASGVVAWRAGPDGRMLGRFGWQGAAISIRDQTINAFAREMGVTSNERPHDDCTATENVCGLAGSAAPEVSDDLVDAVASFVRALPPPEAGTPKPEDSIGESLFTEIGCAACHRPQLPIERRQADGTVVSGVIAAYTDLRLHDLGIPMADTDVAGKPVVSRWRTAPLWGLGFRLKVEAQPTFLHDGRARTAEEAVLWHGGEAAHATYRFMELGPRAREALLHWVEKR
jgi:CxxC motif-containing protein (DUF1111 family)